MERARDVGGDALRRAVRAVWERGGGEAGGEGAGAMAGLLVRLPGGWDVAGWRAEGRAGGLEVAGDCLTRVLTGGA